ncbi:MAG: multiheme c-type cytochrome [Thermodesulfobacteriota bacterium]
MTVSHHPTFRGIIGLALCLATVGCVAASPEPAAGSLPAAEKALVPGPAASSPLDPGALYPRRPPARKWPGLPLTDFQTHTFIGSGRCAVCHDLLTDAAGRDMSISNHWRSTMMANAARDPFWQAKVASEVARNPAIREVIESKCATCHMPAAWTQAYAEGGQQGVLDKGFLSPDSELHQAAMDGVTCSFCHQIRDEKLGTRESFSGKYSVDTGAVAPDRRIFGPYPDPVQKPMRTSVGYTPVYGQHTNDSALCAICHTLFTPFLDGEGNIAGEFPEQTPYLEWKHSAYYDPVVRRYDIGGNSGEGRICQECHMPHSAAGGVIIARWAPPEVREKDHFSQHHFVGGNVLMLDILAGNARDLGLTASSDKLEATRERTLGQLHGDSATLAITDAGRRGPLLEASVRITSLVGHKFPTGFPSRRLWLHVTLTDGAGRILFESGRPADDGTIAGNDNDLNRALYEPHHEEIDSPAQVQIYETIMANSDGQVTYTLLRAASYLKDNRLLPRGFDKATADAAVGVYGRAAADRDFLGGSDLVRYRMEVGNHDGPFLLRAELLYTSITPAFLDDLEADGELELVGRFLRLYDRADRRPVAVAAVEARIGG